MSHLFVHVLAVEFSVTHSFSSSVLLSIVTESGNWTSLRLVYLVTKIMEKLVSAFELFCKTCETNKS